VRADARTICYKKFNFENYGVSAPTKGRRVNGVRTRAGSIFSEFVRKSFMMDGLGPLLQKYNNFSAVRTSKKYTQTLTKQKNNTTSTASNF